MDLSDSLKKKLYNYLDKAKERGYSNTKIKTSLKKGGYDKKTINFILNDYKNKSKKPVKQPWNHKRMIVTSIGIAILIICFVILISYLLPSLSQIDCGNDVDCFVENANKCQTSLLEINEDGTISTYKIEEGCVFHREYTQLSDNEPEIMKDLFEGKSLTCNYVEKNFNEEWVDSITQGIEECDGELVDAIYALIAAQIELAEV